MEFDKAFEKLCHLAIIIKPDSYLFKCFLLDWLADFLKDKKKREVLGENVSEWIVVMSGVYKVQY